MESPRPALWERLLPLELFLLLLAGTEFLYGKFFPNAYGLLGHDFALAHPYLLDGAIWFWRNSVWDVPWFTPSFCGGQTFFADAQSGYYSPVQWLAFLLPPTQASHIDLLLCCSIRYWSFYFLLRSVFELSTRAAIVGGALAMLNNFLPCRFLLGEMGYQVFPLAGFVATALLAKRRWRPLARSAVGNVFWAGLALAMMLHGGLTMLMVPTGLGVLALALIAHLSGRGVCAYEEQAPSKVMSTRPIPGPTPEGRQAGLCALARLGRRVSHPPHLSPVGTGRVMAEVHGSHPRLFQLHLRWWPAGMKMGRFGRQAQVLQDPAHSQGGGHDCEDLHPARALGAFENGLPCRISRVHAAAPPGLDPWRLVRGCGGSEPDASAGGESTGSVFR